MVFAGAGREEDTGRNRERKFMAMGPERSKPPLHNFSMGCLKWGNQKFLRCMKVNPEGGGGGGADRKSSPVRLRQDDFDKHGSHDSAAGIGASKRPRVEGDDGGIEAVRMKLMLDFQAAVDKVKVSLMGEREVDEEAAPSAAAAERPWNLRTRRAACKAPIGDGDGKGLEKRSEFSPRRTGNKYVASPEKKERRKLTVPLSRREIEEDYYAILGERPPRRPKKRARIVQKNLDSLFPGLWLTEITADTYKVPDFPESGKR